MAEPVYRAGSELAVAPSFSSLLPSRDLIVSKEARDVARAGLELNPGFAIARLRSSAFSDNPVYLAGRERVYDGLRKAGVPEEDKIASWSDRDRQRRDVASAAVDQRAA